jgi:hypothetical protein
MAIKVIGAGGIGGCLLRILVQYLNFEDPTAAVVIIDGDRFEPNNAGRQQFTELGNKADVTARDLTRLYPRLNVSAREEYVTEANAYRLIGEGDIVFLCVDNHATRKLVSDRAEELEDILLISGGNELTDGNVQIFFRWAGEDLTLPIVNRFHPELAEPKDRNPGDLSCGEQVESLPQILFMNNMIAEIMLNAYFAYRQGKLGYDEVYADILLNTVRRVRWPR